MKIDLFAYVLEDAAGRIGMIARNTPCGQIPMISDSIAGLQPFSLEAQQVAAHSGAKLHCRRLIMQTDEEPDRAVKPLIGGVFLAGASFVRLLDTPGMTIERLRSLEQARFFRQQMQNFTQWMTAAIAAAPASAITEDELKALLGEIRKSEPPK
jgi:hypothetical protein